MERRHVTLAEAATIAGTSLDTIRRRLKKGELARAQTNRKGVFVDLDSLREAFNLPREAGPAEEKATEAEATFKAALVALEAKLVEMRLAEARAETKHLAEVAGLEGRLAVAQALSDQRQAEIDRLHGIVTAAAVQVPGIRTALRAWLARRLAA